MNDIKEMFEQIQFLTEEEEQKLRKSMSNAEFVYLMNNVEKLKGQREEMISKLKEFVYISIGQINAVTKMIKVITQEYHKSLDEKK